jgi:hypothetical protein
VFHWAACFDFILAIWLMFGPVPYFTTLLSALAYQLRECSHDITSEKWPATSRKEAAAEALLADDSEV